MMSSPAIWLANDCLSQIIRYERLPFCRDGAGNQNRPQRLVAPQLIESGSKGAELLRAMRAQSRIKKNVEVGIRIPLRVRTTCQQIIEAQILN